jgi:Glycosyl transferase family 90
MTQPSTYTSWAMEELLEPWVHYVPLNEDLSDVEEKMQWVIDNDISAKEIARRGKLWISDMIFHPNAQHDDDLIFEGTFHRYSAHFSLNKQLVI